METEILKKRNQTIIFLNPRDISAPLHMCTRTVEIRPWMCLVSPTSALSSGPLGLTVPTIRQLQSNSRLWLPDEAHISVLRAKHHTKMRSQMFLACSINTWFLHLYFIVLLFHLLLSLSFSLFSLPLPAFLSPSPSPCLSLFLSLPFSLSFPVFTSTSPWLSCLPPMLSYRASVILMGYEHPDGFFPCLLSRVWGWVDRSSVCLHPPACPSPPLLWSAPTQNLCQAVPPPPPTDAKARRE